jgi:hypothetical protein
VQAVAADELGIGGGLAGPVDDAHVVVLGGDGVDRVVDVGAVRAELGDRQQHRRTRRQAVDDLIEVLLEHGLVGPVVVAEHDDGDVPPGVEAIVEDSIAEVDEAPALGVDFDIPTARHELLAHLAAVARRRRRHDRVADHQHAWALDELTQRRPAGERVGVDAVAVRQPALARRTGRRIAGIGSRGVHAR